MQPWKISIGLTTVILAVTLATIKIPGVLPHQEIELMSDRCLNINVTGPSL